MCTCVSEGEENRPFVCAGPDEETVDSGEKGLMDRGCLSRKILRLEP